ncbi:hypothetical protein Mgra_00004528 [Meloidogyne graminicola]|uniref:Sugar phosphate transporter domain-containing protein n=1 Tax=Meloidogyne graminicola TaxID=189291 RepID=A0A8S9ZS56_9BILA|nr:hypothetical protein Mgra_00004528 [Meloidogyne graminicola]
MGILQQNSSSSSLFLRISSVIFYAIASIAVIFVNKILLTNYRFPSFLYVAFGQMLTTILILYLLKCLNLLSFPKIDNSIPQKIFPLPIFFAVNLIAGLGGTKIISLPMFTVLRRFSIFLTMLFEYFILGIVPTFGVKFSVFLMIFGSAIAAMFDLSFDSIGYLLICINNFATALNGVYMKKKLNSKDLGKNGLLFYNSLFMLIPLLIFILLNNEETEKLKTFIDEGYLTVPVLFFLALSCIGGLLLNYSVVLCTAHNSALTTVCVGPIKNMFVTYIGMISSGDYIFTWNNFIGINISVFGSILYTYVTFRTKERIISRTAIETQIEEKSTLL